MHRQYTDREKHAAKNREVIRTRRGERNNKDGFITGNRLKKGKGGKKRY